MALETTIAPEVDLGAVRPADRPTAGISEEQRNVWDEFLDRYENDWVLLVREVLEFEPDPFQIEILEAVCRGERRISIRSGHGVGKTTTMALLGVCHALTRFPQKTICTAPTSSQLFDALAAEMKSWFKKLPAPLQELFEIQTEQIKYKPAPEESFIAFRTSRPETPEAMAGVHSANVLLMPDEASGIPEPVFEAGAGSMSGHNATTVLAGNPVRTSGLFFDTHNTPAVMAKWRRIHISCVGHPRISPDFVEDMKARYGEESNAFRVRVLGEFPKGDDDTVIPYELVAAAKGRDVQPHKVRPIWGLDVGRYGNDPSALCIRVGNTVPVPTEIRKGYDTMQVVGWVKAKWDACQLAERPSAILVDAIGIGSGVADRLAELGLPARAINVSESAAMSEQFLNLRAELWFKGRDWFGKKDVRVDDELLGAELVQPRFKYTSNGKRQVESKEDMKKRGVPSPNRADAFLLTLAEDAVTAMDGGTKASWSAPLKRVIKGIV